MAHLQKANSFHQNHDWMQSLRYSELALVKLKHLIDRPIEALDEALKCRFGALNYMDRNSEALECATEWYCLYPTNHTHPPAINASFCLIESCLHNEEYEDAALPDDKREWFTACGAHYLAQAMVALAQHGGDVPPEENQAVGQEAIGLARRALEIHSQLSGAEHENVAGVMTLLADVLEYFNNVDDIEVLRLHERSIAIHSRVEGSMSVNVATGKYNLANTYHKRAGRARDVDDLDREMTNLELALQHYREAARIYRAINYTDRADEATQDADQIVEELQDCITAREEAAVTASTRG